LSRHRPTLALLVDPSCAQSPSLLLVAISHRHLSIRISCISLALSVSLWLSLSLSVLPLVFVFSVSGPFVIGIYLRIALVVSAFSPAEEGITKEGTRGRHNKSRELRSRSRETGQAALRESVAYLHSVAALFSFLALLRLVSSSHLSVGTSTLALGFFSSQNLSLALSQSLLFCPVCRLCFLRMALSVSGSCSCGLCRVH
jgi:hypothetical protein